MFIPWLSNNMIPDTISDSLDTNGWCKWNQETYNSIMNDEKIKELLRTNSFFIQSHPWGPETTWIERTTIDISNRIGRIKYIWFHGIDFIKIENIDTYKIFENIDESSLRAVRAGVYNNKTHKLKLLKINLGILQGPKFILI